MSEMQFEQQADEFGRPPQERTGADLTGKLVQWGLVGSRKEAEYILVGVFFVALLFAFFMFRRGAGAPPPPPVSAVIEFLS